MKLRSVVANEKYNKMTTFYRRNVGHTGTCNSVGYAVGTFLGYVLFTIFGTKDFCNYFRTQPEDHGFIEFSSKVSES